jgi:hypothetical protein
VGLGSKDTMGFCGTVLLVFRAMIESPKVVPKNVPSGSCHICLGLSLGTSIRSSNHFLFLKNIDFSKMHREIPRNLPSY